MKILPFLLIFIFIFASCGGPDTNDVVTDYTKDSLIHSQDGKLYVANTSTKTYHFPDCYMIDTLKGEHRLETKDLDFLRSRMYTSCKICIGQ